MKFGTMPTTAQVRAYLSAHDWRFGWAIGSAGWMYVHSISSDEGNPITVFVPAHEGAEDYTQRILDIGATLQAFDRRERPAIIAEMLATDVTPAPQPPASVA